MEVSKDFRTRQGSTVFCGADDRKSCILLAVKIIEAPVIRSLWTRTFNTSLTQLKWRSPNSSRRQCRERSPLTRRTSTRWPSTSTFHKWSSLTMLMTCPMLFKDKCTWPQRYRQSRALRPPKIWALRWLARWHKRTVEVVEIGDAVEDAQDVSPILMQRPVPTEQTVLKGLSGVCEEKHMSGFLGTREVDRTFRTERDREHGQKDHVTEEQTKRRAKLARQVWVKCGTKTKPLELNDETPEEIERKVKRLVNVNSSEKVFVLCEEEVPN